MTKELTNAKKRLKIIQSQEFMTKCILHIHHPISIRIHGGSMLPVFGDGQIVQMIPILEYNKNIEIMDIIVYHKFADHYTVHRVVNILNGNGVKKYVTKGDNNKQNDSYIVKEEEILGVILQDVESV